MDELVSLARSARESLGKALQALQIPGVPYQLLDVAEPVAMAMRAFYVIEASQGEALGDRGPIALASVRRALSMLQDQSARDAVWEDVHQAMLETLGMANAINCSAPTPAATAAPSDAPLATQPRFADVARMVWGIRAALRHLDEGSVGSARVVLVGVLDELLAPLAPRA
jgi:hypothetical protein